MSKKESLETLKSLNTIQLWIFLMLRSMCGPTGLIKVNESISYIVKVLNGIPLDAGGEINLTISLLRERLGQLAYKGILEADPKGPVNHGEKKCKSAWPLRIEKSFLDFLPTKYRNPEIAEEIAEWKAKLKRSDDLKKTANDTIRRLREELRVSKAGFIPEFKLYKVDGTINKRSVEFQRLWAWFVLLDIQQAFEKAVPDKRPEELNLFSGNDVSVQPDYGTMSVWISTYGLDAIEGLLHGFYMNKRLRDLKVDAGDRWPQAVLRFIYGALKKSGEKDNKKTRDSFSEEKYEPRGGW